MTEVWKPVKNYEGYYEVSNLGNVRSLDRIVHHSRNFTRFQKGNVLTIRTNSTGNYSTVLLSKDNKHKMVKVHRLVATAFIDNPNGYREINHKDENKQNNRVDNLEWCSRKYNENYGTKRIRGSMHTNYKKIAEKNSKALYQVSINGEVLKRWNSLAEVHNTLGYSQGNISMCCNGRHTTPLYGYYWRWVNE